MSFFAYLQSANAPKNKLQVEARKLLEIKSGHLVSDSKDFLDRLREQINFLNDVHSKCSPLNVSTYGIGDGKIGIAFGEHFTVGFYLYAVKKGGVA